MNCLSHQKTFLSIGIFAVHYTFHFLYFDKAYALTNQPVRAGGENKLYDYIVWLVIFEQSSNIEKQNTTER